MNIKDYIEQLKKQRNGKSYAFLAGRVPTSPDSPYRINVVQPTRPEETEVLMLCGSGGIGDNIREYNGYLKQVDEFVKQIPELADKNVRVNVAVCNFGKYHDDETARYLKHLQYMAPEEYKELVNDLPSDVKEETLNPAYINDVFNLSVLPRIAASNGKVRLPIAQALRNIRRLNIVTHCHGGYVAFCLEEMMQSKMKELGYSEKECTQIQKQLLVQNYNPDYPIGRSKSRFVSIESAADEHNRFQTVFKEWLQMTGKKFSLLYDWKQNLLMCGKVDKAGIEGNPPRVYVAVDPNEWFSNRYQAEKTPDYEEPEPVKEIGEHSFMGFKPVGNMSKAALKVQNFANNILSSAIINSVNQPKNGFNPLPPTQRLAVKSYRQGVELLKAVLTTNKLLHQFMFRNRKKLYNFIAVHQNNRVSVR